MANPPKDTLYIDFDDEITAIIDKVRMSSGKIVALVLPKRASVLQSIVNMKLLKKAADDEKKRLVLITSEAGLLPLAGTVGLYVAKSLSSKPEIPAVPGAADDMETVDEEGREVSVEKDGDKPVGQLAGLGAAAAAADDVETVELEDEDLSEVAAEPAAAKSFTPPVSAKKNPKLQVPNFDRFRLLLLLGFAALIILLAGLYYALVVAPKATIAINTDATALNVSLGLKLDTRASQLNEATNTLPARLAKQQKTYTQQVPATGQKNNGAKAAGSVKIALANCNNDTVTIPKGTGVSANGLTYITQATVQLSSVMVGGKCNPSAFSSVYTQSVNVIAAYGGANYNIASGTPMTVAGGSAYKSSDLQASADGDITGGTDNIVKVVSQADIDSAKSKISTADTTIRRALQNELSQENFMGINDTYVAGTPIVTSSAQPGDAADTVTVTEAVTYSMFGVRQADLQKLIIKEVGKQIDTSKQNVLSTGLDKATFSVESSNDASANITLSTVATAGPDLNIASVKKLAAGKKPGFIKNQLQSNPDVKSVSVKLSPFWVTSVPKDDKKITVTIAKPKAPANTNGSGR